LFPIGGGQNHQEAVEGSLPTGAVSEVNPLEGGMQNKKEPVEEEVGGAEIGAVVPTFSDVNSGSMGGQQPEVLNKKALEIVQRVRDKLTGRDFNPRECLNVPEQVYFSCLSLDEKITLNQNLIFPGGFVDLPSYK